MGKDLIDVHLAIKINTAMPSTKNIHNQPAKYTTIPAQQELCL
jgi:hypothetical protein